MNDLEFACRQLVKRPVQTLMLTGILSLGIAGTTSVFSLFNTVFLQPLPIPDQDRVVNLSEADPTTQNENVVPYSHFCAWRRNNQTFESMAYSSQWVANITHNGVTERVAMRYVTHGFFRVLGIHPLLGRTFTAKEDRPGQEHQAGQLG